MMSEPTPVPPRRRRRWFSTSLGGMMVLILVVGGLMGWKARKASLQRWAVARIRQLDGSVDYDWEGFQPIPARNPPGPAWLRKALGDEYFQDVVRVTLPSEESPPGRGEGRLAPIEADQLVGLPLWARSDRIPLLLRKLSAEG